MGWVCTKSILPCLFNDMQFLQLQIKFVWLFHFLIFLEVNILTVGILVDYVDYAEKISI